MEKFLQLKTECLEHWYGIQVGDPVQFEFSNKIYAYIITELFDISQVKCKIDFFSYK